MLHMYEKIWLTKKLLILSQKMLYEIDSCGLYYKSFTIVIYDPNDSIQYYNIKITIISYAPNLTLALAGVINYDHKWWSKLKHNVQS